MGCSNVATMDLVSQNIWMSVGTHVCIPNVALKKMGQDDLQKDVLVCAASSVARKASHSPRGYENFQNSGIVRDNSTNEHLVACMFRVGWRL